MIINSTPGLFVLLLCLTKVYCLNSKHLNVERSAGESEAADTHPTLIRKEEAYYSVPLRYSNGIKTSFSRSGYLTLERSKTDMSGSRKDQADSKQVSEHVDVPRLNRQPCTFSVGQATYFTPTVYSAMCMCGSSGRGRAYALDSAVESCVSSCMMGHNGDVCLASQYHGGFNDEFSDCCTNCGGQEGFMTVTTTYPSSFVGNFKACLAATPTPTPTPTPSSSPPPPCVIDVVQGSHPSIPHLTKKCVCSGYSTGRTFAVCGSVQQCMDTCMSVDEGDACSTSTIIPAALTLFASCCNTCNGNSVTVGFGSVTYTGCI